MVVLQEMPDTRTGKSLEMSRDEVVQMHHRLSPMKHLVPSFFFISKKNFIEKAQRSTTLCKYIYKKTPTKYTMSKY
jgi:hypothetical protein